MNINNNFVATSLELALRAATKKNKIRTEREREQLPFEDILDRDDIEDATVLDNTTIPVASRGNRGGIKIGNLTN